MVHEDTKVIAEEGPSNSKLPGGGDDEYLTESDEHGGDDEIQGFREELDVRLCCNGSVEPCVDGVSEAKRKVGY